ncbi:hypothetical protein CUR86_08205 [Salinicola acroporae]|uniref:Uncharacterized protein n=1 Tax=Salinicola acroporae TaxID=1541440 RepID=A0ABT6I445_9GAMM|nr:hypothetical protein [Salinicola acroporae]
MGLRYEGLSSDRHILDSLEYAKSLEGSSRIYRLVAHYCLHGEVLRPRSRSDLRCYTLPAKSGSYEALLVILTAAAHEIPAFSDVYKSALDWLISKLVGFIKDKLSGQGDVNELVEVIKLQAEKNSELNTILANGLIKSNERHADLSERLLDTLPSLIAAAQSGMRKAVAPVGSSCSTMTQFHDLPEPVSVSEPEAMAIRSQEELVVGKPGPFIVNRIHSLSLDTGACTIEIEGFEGLVNGKVDDIGLKQPGNPYSRALDAHSPLRVRGRPVFKQDQLHKLFITESE